MRSLHPLLLVALASFALVSCRKDKDEDPIDVDYTSASDNSRAEDAFTDMLSVVDKAVSENGLRDDCDPVVTFDTTSSPRTITIDFGEVNCTANNGRQRRGRIQVSYTGRYREQGTIITIVPENYFVNNNEVLGTKTITNMGLNGDGDPYFTVVVSGSLVGPDESWVATHSASRIRTWVAGDNTPELSDDVYMITGTGSGVNRNGLPYNVTITQALRVALNCPFITQGTVQVIPATGIIRTIDYGNGNCDGTFTVTVNGQTFTVTIG